MSSFAMTRRDAAAPFEAVGEPATSLRIEFIEIGVPVRIVRRFGECVRMKKLYRKDYGSLALSAADETSETARHGQLEFETSTC